MAEWLVSSATITRMGITSESRHPAVQPKFDNLMLAGALAAGC
jgi:hypothetical protein